MNSIVSKIQSNKSQNGIDFGNFKKYACYTTKRIAKLKQKKNLLKDRNLMIELELLKAERAWSHYADIKSKRDSIHASLGSEEGNRLKFHFIKRLKRAIQHATSLANLFIQDPDSVLENESKAYLLSLQAHLAFEKAQYDDALTLYISSRSIYSSLIQRKDEKIDYTLRSRWQKQIDDLEPTIRYCGYILGQPTDLTSLLDILESSSTTLSSSNRDHLKNLLHSQLQNQKESNQEKTSFSLLDGIYNGKQITCKVKVENAEHLSLALLMERYRTECESHTLKFPFLDTSLAMGDRVSINKLIEKWVGSSVDCESTFQKEFKNAKKAAITTSSSGSSVLVLRLSLLYCLALIQHASAGSYRSFLTISSASIRDSIKLCDREIREWKNVEVGLEELIQDQIDDDGMEQDGDDSPGKGKRALNAIRQSCGFRISLVEGYRMYFMAKLYLELKNHQASLSLLSLLSSTLNQNFSKSSTLLQIPILEERLNELYVSLKAKCISQSILFTSDQSNQTHQVVPLIDSLSSFQHFPLTNGNQQQQVPVLINPTSQIKECPFRPIFYDLSYHHLEFPLENLEKLRNGQSRIPRIDQGKEENRSLEEKSEKSGVLGWFGL